MAQKSSQYKYQNRWKKELHCGCSYQKHRYGWYFSPKCDQHVAESKTEWKARPWYGKLFVYIQFGFVMLIFITSVALALFLVAGVIYTIIYAIFFNR